jgi:hypothetical protein
MGGVPCGICGKNVTTSGQWGNVGGIPYCLECLSVARIWVDDWKGCPICGAPAGGIGEGIEVTKSTILGATFSCKSCRAQWKIVSDFRVLKEKKFLGMSSKDNYYLKIDAELVGLSSDGRGTLGQRWPVEWLIAKDGKPKAIKKWTQLPPEVRDKLAQPK